MTRPPCASVATASCSCAARTPSCAPSSTCAATAPTSWCRSASAARASPLRCPYHGWTYKPRRVTEAPSEEPPRRGLRSRRRGPRPGAGRGVARLRLRQRLGRRARLLGVGGRARGVRGPLRTRAAEARRHARVRDRLELEADLRELSRVLPLPADPPPVVPRQPARQRRQPRQGRRLRGRQHGHGAERGDDVFRRPQRRCDAPRPLAPVCCERSTTTTCLERAARFTPTT